MLLTFSVDLPAQVMGLSGGMLHTHDEETHTFFQGTKISVGKSLR